MSRDGIPQVVNYHVGVGVSGGVLDKVYGGISGEGGFCWIVILDGRIISKSRMAETIGDDLLIDHITGMAEIVRSGYQFLSSNYVPNDEIFIFGFSRGAYTARSIAGLIDNVGVLTKEGLPYLAEIFRDVQHRHNENYRPRHPDVPFPNKPSVLDPRYAEELERRGLTRLHVQIKVVGVWDTVGSLGTPKIGWLRRLGLQSSASKEHSFYDTSLSSCVENAFQALALDEERYAFTPALWEKFQGNTTTLRQVWFPGAHSNIGGGYDDQQIATISLAWMVSQCTPFMDMNEDYVLDQWEADEVYFEKTGEKPRPWAFGKILNGMEGIYALGGSKTRTPGRYMVIDPETGATTKEALEDTHEYVHPSVRARIKLDGPGLSDRGRYVCEALRDWKLNIEYPDGAKRPNVYWKLKSKDRNVSTRTLPEAPLWGIEKELLDYDPEAEEFIMRPPDESRRRRSRGRKEKRRRTPD
jgi:hypothetical protein